MKQHIHIFQICFEKCLYKNTLKGSRLRCWLVGRSPCSCLFCSFKFPRIKIVLAQRRSTLEPGVCQEDHNGLRSHRAPGPLHEGTPCGHHVDKGLGMEGSWKHEDLRKVPERICERFSTLVKAGIISVPIPTSVTYVIPMSSLYDPTDLVIGIIITYLFMQPKFIYWAVLLTQASVKL